MKSSKSSVPVSRSISLIEDMLVKAGATSIRKFYDNGKVSGFLFEIQNPKNPNIFLTFELPAKIEAVQRALENETNRDVPIEQAERTAFRVLYYWIEAQLSMVEVGKAEITEMFFPYMLNNNTGKTLYAHYEEADFKQLQLTDGTA